MRAFSNNADPDRNSRTDASERSVVYLTNVPFSRRDYDRYGLPHWLAEGYRVCVLDVGPVIFAQREQSWEYSIYRDETFRLEIAKNTADLRKLQPLLDGAELIVDLVTAHGHSRWNLPVLRAVAKSGRPSLVMSVNAYPGYDLPVDALTGIIARLKHFGKRLAAADPLNSVIARLPFRWFGIHPATAVVYGGRRSHRAISTVTNDTLVINGHHMDFDGFLASDLESSEGDYAVFIDQGLDGHREFVENRAFRQIDIGAYYHQLRNLFARVEAKFGLDVVIAKHPHGLSDSLERHLPGRRIVSGETAKLIAGSSLVIVHNSSAMTIAVLRRKPLLVVFSKDYIEASPWNPVCHYPLLDALHRRCLYLEELNTYTDDELFADLTSGFQDYINDYVTLEPQRKEKLWPLISRVLRENQLIDAPPSTSATSNIRTLEAR